MSEKTEEPAKAVKSEVKAEKIEDTVSPKKSSFSNKLSKTALALAMFTTSIYIQAKESHNQSQDREDEAPKEIKTNIKDNSKADDKTIGWKDAIDYYEKDGDVVPMINNKVFYGIFDKSPKKELKEFHKQQRKDFRNSEGNKTDTIDASNLVSELAFYSQIEKSIHTKFYQGIEYLKKKLGISKDNSEEQNKINKRIKLIEDLNNPKSQIMQVTFSHENNHMVADKLGTYAPGLSSIEYAKVYQYDEIAANVASLYVLENNYNKALKEGKSKDEALKEFDIDDGRYDFYKEAVKNGLDTNSKEATALKVSGTCQMWERLFKVHYTKTTISHGTSPISSNNAISLTVGNDEEYNRRKKAIFDHIGDNKYLKELGITVGNISQYLPEKDIDIPLIARKVIERETKENTGMTTEEMKALSDKIPGNQKSDIEILNKTFKREIKEIRAISSKKQQNKKNPSQEAIIYRVSRNGR